MSRRQQPTVALSARGNAAVAEARLLHVVIHTDEPEALALLGELHARQGLA